MSDFESIWQVYRERTEGALAARLSARALAGVPKRLREAMQYACLNGGKRFRAMLVYACGELRGTALARLDAPAAAVEMIHAYSLVHDDLPAMDDDDVRRCRPSCHIAYDESTALLAGDALQSRAFEVLSADAALNLPAERRLRMVDALASAIGAGGMAGGQMLDMEAVGGVADRAALERMHRLKTGALIRAAACLGGLASMPVDGQVDAPADDRFLELLDEYAANIGLAFQVIDDVLDEDASGDAPDAGAAGADFGKPRGADRRMGKATFVSMLGMETARAEARKLSQKALETAALLGDNAGFLQQLALFVVERRF